jgi:hypothetical protein
MRLKASKMKKLPIDELRKIINEELSLIKEAASDDIDSVDRQIDGFLLDYEKESQVKGREEGKTLRAALKYLFEAPEDEEAEEDEEAPEPTPEEDPDAATDDEVKDMITKLKGAGYDVRLTVDNSSVAVDDPGQEVQLPLNADAFADRVARLISNSENLLSIETVIRNRVRQFMLDRYDKASADDVDDKLDVLTRKAGEFSDDIDAPMGHGAGASKLA